VDQIEQAGGSGNDSDTYSGGTWFGSWSGHRLSWQVLMGFPWSL
jgi:hypothetical protein